MPRPLRFCHTSWSPASPTLALKLDFSPWLMQQTRKKSTFLGSPAFLICRSNTGNAPKPSSLHGILAEHLYSIQPCLRRRWFIFFHPCRVSKASLLNLLFTNRSSNEVISYCDALANSASLKSASPSRISINTHHAHDDSANQLSTFADTTSVYMASQPIRWVMYGAATTKLHCVSFKWQGHQDWIYKSFLHHLF